MRILTSLTSVAFFSACSSFSWASFNDSEYLSSSSSTPFSFFCRPSSSSSSYTQTHKGNLRGIWEQCREKKIAGLTFCFNTSCSSRLISEIVLGIFCALRKRQLVRKTMSNKSATVLGSASGDWCWEDCNLSGNGVQCKHTVTRQSLSHHISVMPRHWRT